MSIYHPSYLEFIKRERKTVEWLKNSPNIQRLFNDIALSAQISYYNLPSRDKDLSRTDFRFQSHFKLLIARENRNVLIILDIQVTKNFGVSNYVLSISDNISPPYNLVRKFHFDYAKSYDSVEPKPAYHLQYGGLATPSLTDMGISTDHLSQWLSNPRICSYPINLALLIDSIFCEFVSTDTQTLVNSAEWRQLVKENEDGLIKPYIKGMNHFINGNHTSDFLIRDCLYGKQ